MAAGSIYVLSMNDETHSLDVSVIARVNTDGSGIYIQNGYTLSDFFELDSEGNIIFDDDGIPEGISSAWAGKTFATPGVTSIQHIQLMEIVESMGLDFNTPGVGDSSTTVYFIAGIATLSQALANSSRIVGGIIWEPVYHAIADSSEFTGLVTTNVLFPGHTCCIIAGKTSYLTNNTATVLKFLAAYAEGVDWVNNAISTKGADYDELVQIGMQKSGQTETIVEEALSGVVYKFADSSTGSLEVLKSDLISLTDTLLALPKSGLTNTMEDLGFSNSTDFIDALVNDSYMRQALVLQLSDIETTSSITVGAIAGDIHQVVLYVCESLGFYEEYKLDVNITNTFTNGGAVAADLFSSSAGSCDISFLGAPPLVIRTINNG
ncbi:MAG: hypothetical protein RBR05_02700 [Candidatus Methanomethylophilaceae archaeon]|nr:hypothetical protein [Candidatus Methanomethylophilaceae archaeon]MDD3378834.1 hypothetical protein [Candidatus Methanomethylophilaceae archaeon]MDY0224296.1 hypothetical protein [Candidatus Methanomethylophilaceae archaeon]